MQELGELVQLLTVRIIKEGNASFERRLNEISHEMASRGLRGGVVIGARLRAYIDHLNACADRFTHELIELARQGRGALLLSDDEPTLRALAERFVDQLGQGLIRRLDGDREMRPVEHGRGELQRATEAKKGDARQTIAYQTRIDHMKARASARSVPTTAVVPPAAEAVAAQRRAQLELEGLHPRVVEVAEGLYRDGHFRQAILDAYIALVEAVKARSGITADNTGLMQTAFSAKNPVLKVSDDADEQLGFMWLYSGAVMAIRNPKAHRLIEQKDPQRALEWLAFASVLFRVLDDAAKTGEVQHERTNSAGG